MPTTTNMNLVLPTVSTTIGPVWASMLNTAMDVVDTHDHSTGKGVRITPSGLNISSDLNITSNNLFNVRSLRLDNQSGSLTGTTDLNIVYVKSGELYYRDASGNQVQLTNGGSIAGVAGNITGLTSPAAVTYSSIAKSYVFTSDSNESAEVACGDLRLYYKGAVANSIALKAPSGLSNYTLTFPTTTPSSSIDSGGNNTYALAKVKTDGTILYDALAQVPLGGVIELSTIGSAYQCVATTTADTFGFVLCGGQTISDATSPMNGAVIPDYNSTSTLYTSLLRLTNWTSFTPTISWVTNATRTGYYRYVGESLEMRVLISLTGAPTSTTLTVTLPNSETINTTALVGYNSNFPTPLGYAVCNDTSVSTEGWALLPHYSSSTAIQLRTWGTGNQRWNLSSGPVNATTPFTFANGDTVNLFVNVPVNSSATTTINGTKQSGFTYVMRVK